MMAGARRITRREFGRRAVLAAAGVAGPLILPRVARGATPANARVTLGMIGVGSRGADVMHGFARHDDVRIVAVADPFRQRREAARAWLDERYGGRVAAAYEDFRELLARPDIDGVVICTPDHWHVPAAYLAVVAGKDVYVEKPLGVSLAWAWRLRAAAARYGAVFQYGTQQRSDRNFRFACELVRNGYIGTVQRVQAWCPDVADDWGAFSVPEFGSTEPAPVPEGFNYDLWLGPAPLAPYTVDRCRREGAFHIYDYALGFIAGWGAHPLDIAQWGLDADGSGPVRIEGRGELPRHGLLDTLAWWDVQAEYAGGVRLHFLSQRLARPLVMEYRTRWCNHGTTFFGAEGWVSVDREGLYASDPNLLKLQLRTTDVHLPRSPGHDRDFIASIRTRQLTVSPLEAAIRSDTISHLADLTIRLGRPLSWDPACERFVDDQPATRLLTRAMRTPHRL